MSCACRVETDLRKLRKELGVKEEKEDEGISLRERIKMFPKALLTWLVGVVVLPAMAFVTIKKGKAVRIDKLFRIHKQK